MRLENKYVAIWLLDEAARLFLGLSQLTKGAAVAEDGPTRWEVLGKVQSHGESPVGVWLEIDVLKERRGPKAQVTQVWKVSPPLCLIKWDFIISLQLHGEEIKGSPRFGFQQT